MVTEMHTCASMGLLASLEGVKSAKPKKGKKRISAREFDKRFTELTMEHLSTLPSGERETRLRAAENRLGINVHGIGPKSSCSDGSEGSRLIARSQDE